MNHRNLLVSILLCSLAAGSAAVAGEHGAAWPQFGGPDRNFVVDSPGLADTWPEDGPKRLWSKELGDGFSSIVVDGTTLYTMHRPEGGDKEAVIALDGESGDVVWEFQYASPIPEKARTNFGTGPNATPLLHGDHIYTVGFGGVFHCIDKKSGTQIWKKELWKEFEGTFLVFGYASSPMVYGDDLIVLLGGEGNAVVSLGLKDGQVNWKTQSYQNSYTSPILINVDGEDQVVAYMGTKIAGLDAKTGKERWSLPSENQWKTNCATPHWIADKSTLLFATSGGLGCTAVKLSRDDEATKTEELWVQKKAGLGHTNFIRVGNRLYATTGDSTQNFTTVDVETGAVLYRQRGFAKSNFVFADGKLIVLDEDGNLMLVAPGEESAEILAKTPILEKAAWTAPTLVGTRLFVRDRKTIIAFELPQKS